MRMYKTASNFNQQYRCEQQTSEDHKEPEPLQSLDDLKRKRKKPRGIDPHKMKFKQSKSKMFTGL